MFCINSRRIDIRPLNTKTSMRAVVSASLRP